MKRIANTLPLLALTALLLPACSFSMQAGKGSAKNPNPTAKPNPGGNSGGSSSKKVTKSNGGGGGSGFGGTGGGGGTGGSGLF